MVNFWRTDPNRNPIPKIKWTFSLRLMLPRKRRVSRAIWIKENRKVGPGMNYAPPPGWSIPPRGAYSSLLLLKYLTKLAFEVRRLLFFFINLWYKFCSHPTKGHTLSVWMCFPKFLSNIFKTFHRSIYPSTPKEIVFFCSFCRFSVALNENWDELDSASPGPSGSGWLSRRIWLLPSPALHFQARPWPRPSAR